MGADLQVAACVWPGGVKRNDEESMTLNPETPITLAFESTTAMVSFALPIMPAKMSVHESLTACDCTLTSRTRVMNRRHSAPDILQ